jgi:uncharacterized protein DUF5655
MQDEYTDSQLFVDKPHNRQLFLDVQSSIEALGAVKKIVTRTQVSYGAARKFAWVWMTPSTKKTPEGTLMLTLDMRQETSDPLFASVEKIRTDKWTHQLPITNKTRIDDIERKGWLQEAYLFGIKNTD